MVVAIKIIPADQPLSPSIYLARALWSRVADPLVIGESNCRVKTKAPGQCLARLRPHAGACDPQLAETSPHSGGRSVIRRANFTAPHRVTR